MKDSSRSVRVWDLPTRLFHGALVAFVVTGFLTGADEGVLLMVHTWVGYVVLLLVLFRIAWGFVGGEHARFRSFVRPWPEVGRYLGRVARLVPERHLGHTPLGGWMILLMLATLLAVALSGMLVAEEGFATPLSRALPGLAGEGVKALHEFLGNAVMVLAAIHLAAVAGHRLLTGDRIVRAMVTGSKPAPEGEAWSDARPAGRGRAAALAFGLLVLGGYLVAATEFGAGAEDAEGGEESEEGGEGERDDD